jgi:hypothetical protein
MTVLSFSAAGVSLSRTGFRAAPAKGVTVTSSSLVPQNSTRTLRPLKKATVLRSEASLRDSGQLEQNRFNKEQNLQSWSSNFLDGSVLQRA